MRKRTAKHILLGLFIVIGMFAKAQLYPVRSNLVLSPPYPMNIGTYAQDDYMGMQLNIVLNDNNSTNYLVGLKLVIEGQSGVRIETAPSDSWQHTMYLNPGLNSVDLSILHPLFEPDNLVFSNVSSGDEIPEGMYRFKVEVYDVARNVLISDPYSGMHICWISMFQPPILTLPVDGQVISTPTENTNVPALFSWMPRGIYPGITNIEYTLEITEIYDESIAPEELFAGGDNDIMTYSLTTILTSKSLSFPTDFVGMQPDRWYAWRVIANDLNDKVHYRNAGQSEVRRFYFGTPCENTEELIVESLNENSVQLSWSDYDTGESYFLQFRNKTLWGNWVDIDDPVSGMELVNLNPGTTYEFRLAKDCGAIVSDYVYAEYINPGILDIDCMPPVELSARVENSILWGEKLSVDWERMPGVLEYQVDVRCEARTLSQQTTATNRDFRWGSKGIYGDTIWVRTGSQCWEDSAFVFGDEQELIMTGGASGTGCTAPEVQIDSAITYPTGITEVYWPAHNIYKSYTLLWRPAGMSAQYQSVGTIMPPAIVQGIMDGDSIECRLVYHCYLGSDTTDIMGFSTRRASDENFSYTGSCYEPSYADGFVPSHTSMHLVWEPEPNAQTYEVNWKKKSDYIWNVEQVNDQELIVENLEQDSTYLFRIRTVCDNGIGFSRWTEVDSVSLATLSSLSDGCPEPAYDQIDVNSAREASISFEGDLTYTAYGAEYRIKTQQEWTMAENRGNAVIFSNLSPETTYEVRTRGFCGLGRSEYTAIDTFTTPEAIFEEVLECGNGSGEDSGISNTTPITELPSGTRIIANGWELYIKNVTAGGDTYNGSAFAKVPYLKHSMVEFTLENAKVNTDSVMFGGRAIVKGINVQLIDPAVVARIENLINIAEMGLEEAQEVIDELQGIVDMIPSFSLSSEKQESPPI